MDWHDCCRVWRDCRLDLGSVDLVALVAIDKYGAGTGNHYCTGRGYEGVGHRDDFTAWLHPNCLQAEDERAGSGIGADGVFNTNVGSEFPFEGFYEGPKVNSPVETSLRKS